MWKTGLTLFGFLCVAMTTQAEAPVDYQKEVKPILRERCFACHGGLKQEANLRVDTVKLLHAGGDSGSALESGDPESSLLYQRIADADPTSRMPPEGKPLTTSQLAILNRWIAQGAVGPDDEKPEADPKAHWAFQPPKRPELPAVRDKSWGRNAIDAFIAIEQEKRGLARLPEADKLVLLRRVYLDLIGLPPTREQLHAFLADPSADAYEKVVDQLLDSPAYGERWGRHWMDVWRYSDWYGRRGVPDVLNSYAQIWRWRDWIIHSLNDDKGYDQMLQQMLAADELLPADDANQVATGFIVRNFYRWNYNTWMKDAVEHTSKAFLGLTLNCCHCHDHKYDPIANEEYFRFRAFFEPIEIRHDRVPGEADPGEYPKYDYAKSYKPITSGLVRIMDEKLDAQTFVYTGGEERNVIAGRPAVTAGAPAILGGDKLEIHPVDLPATSWYPGLKPFVQAEETAKRQQAVTVARAKLETAKRDWEQSQPALLAAVDRAGEAADTGVASLLSHGLVGTQSLVLDAVKGRRTLARPLPELKQVDGETVVQFQIEIRQDGHCNFQLGLDIDQGATGAYVAFEAGKILSYRPGSFETIEVGKYDWASGQCRFDATLSLDPGADRLSFTLRSLADGKVLVEDCLVALNGWNPIGNAKQGIFLDAREGTKAVIDEITFTQSQNTVQLRLDFEPAVHERGSEIDGTDHWRNLPFSVAPATSLVCGFDDQGNPLPATVNALSMAKTALTAGQLKFDAAQAEFQAAEAELLSIQTRIAADKARFLDQTEQSAVQPLIAEACRAEKEAKVASARSLLAQAEMESAVALAMPASDEKRAAALSKTQTSVGQARQQLADAEKGLSEPATDYTPLSPKYPKQSTGRRAALAKWLTNRDNPITARVAVNHIWLRHFGRAIVKSTENLGRGGDLPTHPQLLDWLAVELMENNWQMKPLHRLIVTSSVYRLASPNATASSPTEELDRDNVYLWRFNTQRMEAEVLRDSILSVAGCLDRTIGGVEIDQSLGLTTPRRSLYFAHHGEGRMPFLELFDSADPCDCYRRSSSIRPQQALAMTNSELALQQGRLLVARLQADPILAASDDNFVYALFERMLGRSPSSDEKAACVEFLQKQQSIIAADDDKSKNSQVTENTPSTDPAIRARQGLAQALFSHTDFVTIR